MCAWARTRLFSTDYVVVCVGLAALCLGDIARDELCFYCQLCAGAACGIIVAGGDFARIERVITLGRPKNQRAESR